MAWTQTLVAQGADATVTRYLINIATPPPGATCMQDVVPFADG